MSLLINESYANPAQPLWQPYGSGGGPTGPTGPTGPAGTAGPTGPAGMDSDVQVLQYDPYPSGLPLAIGGGATYTTSSTVVITPLVNGKLYMEAFCRYVNSTGPAGAAAVLTFKVNGTLIGDVPAVTQAYTGNINFLNSSSWQIPCTAGTPYTIEAVGQSTHFSGSSDNVIVSSRLWCFASQ